MKKIVALGALLALASVAMAQTAPFLSGPFDEAMAKAKAENKPVLIDFFSGG